MSIALLVLTASLCAAPAAESPAPQAPLRVLLVTGVDYPGHLWKQTAPVLREVLQQDKRLEVRVVDDPGFLANDEIFQYQVIFVHFKNYDPVKNEKQAQENLTKFVKQGGGLVFFHFACGAFEQWPEFLQLAGRVWDKKKRGHDPHGEFTVKIVDPEHPVTRGMKDFSTVDELYTCLGGEHPIHVLAVSKSKVDGLDYPMAFVFACGQGRVFHSPLGHDVRAIQQPGVIELMQRACLWAGGREP
jgi:type 1 glutamine amidotransferase